METKSFATPYAVLIGNETHLVNAKTGSGLVEWRRDGCAGQIRFSPDAVDLGIPDLTLEDAVCAGVKSIIIGVAPDGGRVGETWTTFIAQALRLGLSLVSGLHQRFSDIEELSSAAQSSGARIIEIRRPPKDIPVATGVKRTGKRGLTVGTDCALGKKYTSLQLHRDLLKLGAKADFRATGQTGIMIAGSGIPLDAIAGDFISGAAELLSPPNEPDHWDVIEGQGALTHPAYGAVSYGLILGSQPDAIVLCHAPERAHIDRWPSFQIPPLEEVIQRNLEVAKQTNPACRCVGISLNTQSLPSSRRLAYLAELSDEFQLPCVDPLITGTAAIAEQLIHGDVKAKLNDEKQEKSL